MSADIITSPNHAPTFKIGRRADKKIIRLDRSIVLFPTGVYHSEMAKEVKLSDLLIADQIIQLGLSLLAAQSLWQVVTNLQAREALYNNNAIDAAYFTITETGKLIVDRNSTRLNLPMMPNARQITHEVVTEYFPQFNVTTSPPIGDKYFTPIQIPDANN